LRGQLAPLHSNARHSSLVQKKGALGGAERFYLEERREGGFGTGIIAPAQRLERESKTVVFPEHSGAMFTVDVVTLFPEIFAPFVGLSIVGRAVERNLVAVRYHHLLDELVDGERADDTPFGGGAGMVLRIEPIVRALDRLLRDAPSDERRLIVVPSPSGRRFTQRQAERWSKLDRLVLICGHYEGIDDRLASLYDLEEWSLGDFVVTGGELPALAFMDATIRLVAGALRSESVENESFAAGLLDYPSFTRPATFRGVDVPPVLLSGDHAKIAQWRREQSRQRTADRRSDLLTDHDSGTKSKEDEA
jgi:tRNA (guanine37-N1)-methyltransferase